MHRLLRYGAVLGLVAAAGGADAAERRTIGRVGAGLQLGGFYDLWDPAFEVRGWRGSLGASLSFGQHVADASEPGFDQVTSDPGKQLTGGVLVAFVNPKPGRPFGLKVYGTAGLVHVTQARATWRWTTPTRGGTIGESAVEGGTGTWPFAGAGAEFAFAAVPGLALGTELLFTFSGGGGVGPGVRFGLRYYPW